jgi:hypothetical protein
VQAGVTHTPSDRQIWPAPQSLSDEQAGTTSTLQPLMKNTPTSPVSAKTKCFM